jgi:peptidoglycan hydrolase-like protein with peptidoglycan-binding domain
MSHRAIVFVAVLSLLIGGVCSSAGFARAQESDATIQELQGRVRELQDQISALRNDQNTAELGEKRITRPLSIGDSGPQVRWLQQALNATEGIRVAARGPGSPGSETRYFGPKTQQAVKAFQERHAQEVLAPAGLSHATGYVGPRTRDVINSRIQQARNSGQTTENADDPSSPTVFPANPTDADFRGSSSTAQRNPKAPTIEEISPASGNDGTTVTIHGERFGRGKNTVEMNMMPPSEYPIVFSADGETLHVTVDTHIAQMLRERLPDYHGGERSLAEISERLGSFPDSIKVLIRVKNTNGVSNSKTFTLTGI